VIASWKGYFARSLHIRLYRGFFDHRIRRSESLNEKWNYIVMNPVRAGFVKKPEEWPYRWSPEGTVDRPGHPRTSETLVRTKQALHFKTLSPSEGTDDRPGHPRTSRMLVRTNPHLPAAIGGAIPTSALARSCSITLFASSFNACSEASLIFPL
jgi:hypothetical protein